MRRLLVLTALAACGDSHSTNDAMVPDASVDSSPDAATTPAQLTVLANDQPITEWTFANTSTGATAAVTVFVRNDGATAAELAVAIGTSAYSIDAAGSTCHDLASLAPGAYCHVRIAFAPSTAGPQDGSLELVAGASSFALPLHGFAFGPPAGLTADVSSVDFGAVYDSSSSSWGVLLVNNGSTAASLDSLVVTGAGFSLGGNNCPSSLTAGGACTVSLRFQATTPGPATGTFTVTSGTTQIVVSLSGYRVRTFTIVLAGGGTGAVTSMPDVQCGQPCWDNALGTVVLTASPSMGSLFAGWGWTCGTSPTCTFGPGGSVSISARFELLGAKAITITFAGIAPGFVFLHGPGVGIACTSSCTTYVPSGTAVTIYGYTPSTFGGWTGDCTSSSSPCDLGTVVNDRAATVTFNRDDREIATLLPSTPVTGLAMIPTGDLVVANANGVTRMTISGTVIWTTPIAGGAKHLATDAAGNVYGVGGPGIFSLTSAGAMRWTRAITVAPNPLRSVESTIAVSPDGSVVAAHMSDGAVVLDGTGADRFAVSGLASSDGMAVAPNGTVAIGTRSTTFPPALDLLRYAANGTALTSLIPLPGERDASLVYDAQNALCAQTMTGGYARVSRIDTNLSTVFSNGQSHNISPTPPSGIIIDSDGNVIAMRGLTTGQASGMRLEAFTPTGTSTWTHVKPLGIVYTINDIAADGVLARAIAGDGNHHIAIGGEWGGIVGWIQVYQMP